MVALAQVMRGDDSQDDDPSGYLALVPVLLWTAQPDLTRQETDRLNEAIPGLLAKLRKGLKTINYPAVQTSAFLQRLVALHQAAFESGCLLPPHRFRGGARSGLRGGRTGRTSRGVRSCPAGQRSDLAGHPRPLC